MCSGTINWHWGLQSGGCLEGKMSCHKCVWFEVLVGNLRRDIEVFVRNLGEYPKI